MTGPAPTCSGKTNSMISQEDSARRPGGREAIQRCQLLEHSGERRFGDWAHLPWRQALIGRGVQCYSPLPRVQSGVGLFKTWHQGPCVERDGGGGCTSHAGTGSWLLLDSLQGADCSPPPGEGVLRRALILGTLMFEDMTWHYSSTLESSGPDRSSSDPSASSGAQALGQRRQCRAAFCCRNGNDARRSPTLWTL